MIDYLQPEFYKFNQDSLILVREVISSGKNPQSLLDIGAGSGVIGIELALKLSIPIVHFLELQNEWEPYLSGNIEKFIPQNRTHIFWTSVGEWKADFQYDLIVSNPPYYLPDRGRISPDPVRAKCRSFLEDDWKTLFQKSSMALKRGGSAFFVTAIENLEFVKAQGKGFPLKFIEKGNVLILELSSPE